MVSGFRSLFLTVFLLTGGTLSTLAQQPSQTLPDKNIAPKTTATPEKEKKNEKAQKNADAIKNPTAKTKKVYTDFQFQENDCLIFGRETRGLPEDLLEANRERCLTIPMPNPNVRSLNLATSVGIALYEALRQTRNG